MIDFLINAATFVVPFLVLLTVLVYVHEMGHYQVARWCGVRVETFSIGFGREIYGWTNRHGTRWKISWLPLGGYVKFFGDLNATSSPSGEILDSLGPEERAVAFHYKKLWQRTLIVVAGPAANLIYSVVILALVFMTFGDRITRPEVGYIFPDGAAAQAGLERGDVIVSVDGRGVDRFEQVAQVALMNPGKPMALQVMRGDRRLELTLVPAPVTTDRLDGVERTVGDIGLIAATPPLVGGVRSDSPAGRAGFQPGDTIVAVDGVAVAVFWQLQDIVRASKGRALEVEVRRGEEILHLVVAAEKTPISEGGEERYLIGIRGAPPPPVRLGLAESIPAAVVQSVDLVDQTVDYLGQMIVGDRGTEDLGGPLRIAHVSGRAAKGGWEQFIMLSILLSLNLGLINLLPVPVLDGGHLLLYAFEAVRGRPLTERMQEYASRFGLVVILSLAIFVTWNDLVQLRIVDIVAGVFS